MDISSHLSPLLCPLYTHLSLLIALLWHYYKSQAHWLITHILYVLLEGNPWFLKPWDLGKLSIRFEFTFFKTDDKKIHRSSQKYILIVFSFTYVIIVIFTGGILLWNLRNTFTHIICFKQNHLTQWNTQLWSLHHRTPPPANTSMKKSSTGPHFAPHSLKIITPASLFSPIPLLLEFLVISTSVSVPWSWLLIAWAFSICSCSGFPLCAVCTNCMSKL